MILYTKRACGALFRYLCAHRGCYLIPVNSCPVVPYTLLEAGCTFKFIDISLKDFCIDQERVINELLNNSYRKTGVIFIHTYGCEYDVTSFAKRVKDIDPCLHFIEDKCLCFPNIEQKNLPDCVDMVLYSTGSSKCVDLGGGGWSISNDYDFTYPTRHVDAEDYNLLESNYKRCLSMGIQLVDVSSYNWLDISLLEKSSIAAYEDKVRRSLEESMTIKTKLNQIYQTKLPSEIQFSPTYNQWRFNIRVKSSKYLLTKIFEQGLFASRHYQPVYKLFNDDGYFSNATKLHLETVNLFNDRYFSEENAVKLCKVINSIIQYEQYDNIQ
ncbi:MAG: hypothetical protein IKY67_09145 [Paludibacteraceae bacterium]|nr:hypothetical protein [Paludibacteraceae bacterium]